MINAQINHSTEAMEIDIELDNSTIRMGDGKTMATFLVLHQLRGEIFHKKNYTAKK